MDTNKTSTLGDFFAEEEARLIAESKAAADAERAAWNALTPEEKAAELAKIEARQQAEHDKGVRLGWWDEDGNPLEAEEEEEEEEEE